VDVLSVGWKKPRSLQGKVALMEQLDPLLRDVPGDVNLATPCHIISLIEDCREPEPSGGWRAGFEPSGVQPPSSLFLARTLSRGAADHLHRFALSTRPYLGRTTLPPSMALLMANAARVKASENRARTQIVPP
jgi:hypothetical protein